MPFGVAGSQKTFQQFGLKLEIVRKNDTLAEFMPLKVNGDFVRKKSFAATGILTHGLLTRYFLPRHNLSDKKDSN